MTKENEIKEAQMNDEVREEWKIVKGSQGIYEVSSFGRVKSHKQHKRTDEFMRGYLYEVGYKKVGLRLNNKSQYYFVHRLVALHFIPNPQDLPHINHKDGNKSNNQVSNLEWCDALYNNRYSRYILRRNPVGEKHGRAKLTNKQALEIVKSINSQNELSRKYGITQANIGKIKNGIHWGSVTGIKPRCINALHSQGKEIKC